MSNDQHSGDGARQETPDIRALERRLDDARVRVRKAVEALRRRHRGGEMEEFRAAVDAQHEAERSLALARGEPAAMALPWEPRWDAGVPAPHVLSSGRRTLLLYRVSRAGPCVGRLQRSDGRCHGRDAGDDRDGLLRWLLRPSFRRAE